MLKTVCLNKVFLLASTAPDYHKYVALSTVHRGPHMLTFRQVGVSLNNDVYQDKMDQEADDEDP